MCTVAMLVKAAIIICTVRGWKIGNSARDKLSPTSISDWVKERKICVKQGALIRRRPVGSPILEIGAERDFFAFG
jgi:hypothetical protein